MDKGQVEPVLVAAQRAVLNPSKSWKEYVYELRPELDEHHSNGRRGQKQSGGAWAGFGRKGKKKGDKSNAEEDFEVKFSPNVVCMEVSGSVRFFWV